jgi:hypothetical protein
MSASSFYQDGYKAGFCGERCLPPDSVVIGSGTSAVFTLEYREGYADGQQATRGTKDEQLRRTRSRM